MSASVDDTLVKSEYSHYIIIGCSIAGLVWGGINAMFVNKVELHAENIQVKNKETDSKGMDEEEIKLFPWSKQECKERMETINQHIKDGAITFLKKEYTALGIFCSIFAILVLCAVDMPWAEGHRAFPFTMFAFIIGACTSMLCGYIGMKIATVCNYKTTYLCNIDRFDGFKVAFQGGQVLGFCLVGLALLILEILILSYRAAIKPTDALDVEHLFEFISGYGLGGSTVALFGRVGGGIYTKAADVGADLAGKVEASIPEDSPKNPGTIADNVGDNVGDIAGMGADLFGSLAESTCAALVVSTTSASMRETPEAIYFPLIVTAVGIIASFICQFFAYIKTENVETTLKVQLWVSTVLMSAMIIPTIYVLPVDGAGIMFAGETYNASRWECYVCIILGLWSGLAIGLITEYYTSKENRPTQELAEACEYGGAPNIINGLALGYLSCVIPIFCLAITVLVSFKLAAMYGVALAAIGMLGCLPIALSIDGYGPISDNAGGIAEMSNLVDDIRDRTDALDAAGNTTAAIGKGFAIGSACLVALALFGAFVTRVSNTIAGMDDADRPAEQAMESYKVNILEPFTFAGLLIGAMLPYWFSAMTMKAVGDAAQEMLEEIRKQFKAMAADPGLQADHEHCISISTNASLKKMVMPGVLVIVSPLLAGSLFGYQATNGILAGCIVSGIQIAFSASNSGGAWDNAKKYVEAGSLKIKGPDGEMIQVKKGDDAHAAAVCGDTVGDPLKDTSGPSINILIKLSAICSLVFGTFLTQYGGLIAGGVKMSDDSGNNVSPVIPTA